MSTFSRRYKYNVIDIQLECASEVLKNRIFAAFYKMLKDNDLKLKKILEKNNEANKKIEDNLAQK